MSEVVEKIPSKYCRFRKKECKWFTWTGNYQEEFCGLYMKFTGTDQQYPSKKRPEFCKAFEVRIIEND